MPVTILTGQNKAPYFTSESIQELPHSTGWWYLVQANDIDNDGDLDIIAGNYGLNSQMKPGPEQPLTADAADIDNNGSMDAIISYYIQGKSYPVATRDELLDQVPSFRAKYPSYESYSNATVNDFFTKDQFAAANHLKVEEFRSGIFINDNSSFHFAPFPREAQAFPVRDVQASDFNHDGTKDLLLTGNNFGVRAQTGKNDAGKGLLLIQDKDKNFSPGGDTGFYTNKDARRMVRIDNFIIVANNNDKIQVFRID
jgi:hypothetical protein